jgi:BirA family biotin operon repressor/biotin-[acetyl-CoA-carboxylase] ligase
MSILFRPTLPPVDAYRLVMVAGLAYADACEQKTEQSIGVKWPNDLICGGKKVAGILAESAIEDQRLLWVIVGIGLNVNQVFEPSDPLAGTATSLRMYSGKHIDRVELLGQIASALHQWYARINEPVLIESWRNRCITLGQRVTVSAPSGNLTGFAEDVATEHCGYVWRMAHCIT